MSSPMHINLSADTTAITVSVVCPRCGTIGKSGGMSCCGRGGYWFKNCGGTGKIQHTWYEGIQACKARSQSKTIGGQQLNVAQQKDILLDSSQGTNMTYYKSAIATIKESVTSVSTSTSMSDTSIVTATYTSDYASIATSARTLMTNTSTNIEMTYPFNTSVSTPKTTCGCAKLLKITLHINLLFIIIF